MDSLTPEQIREARRTAIAAIRLRLQDQDADCARLLRESENIEGVAMALVSFAAAFVVPAPMLKEASPYELLDRMTAWAVSDEGGRPGTELA